MPAKQSSQMPKNRSSTQNDSKSKKKQTKQPKGKVFAEDRGLAHLIALSTQIASEKGEQEQLLVARAHARQAKAEEDKMRHQYTDSANEGTTQQSQAPPKSDLARVKSEIQEKKREKRKQRRGGKRARQSTVSAATIPPKAEPPTQSAEKASEPKAKPRKSVSFAC